jgi:D-psicose/D-tagatose/L-ribulose 3-epimerase
MKIALCNEVLAPMPFPEQCKLAKALGYDGLELAPMTFGDDPHRMSVAELREIRRIANDAGLAITGLHWLLRKPGGLSISSADATVRAKTLDVMKAFVEQCAILGGTVLVHGSPGQRKTPAGETHAVALARVQEAFAAIAPIAGAAGVTYCVEPLGRQETDVINTIEEAAAIVDAINHPNLRTMLDCSAAGLTESESIPALIDRWFPTGRMGHVQVNDPNRRAPGQGAMHFAPILAALKRNRYAGVIAVEPFDYVPDGPGAAAWAIGYLRGLLETA